MMPPVDSSPNLTHLIDEAKLTAVFAGLPMGVVVHALDGGVISANASALNILGLSFDEIIGMSSTNRDWQSVREDGSPYPGEEHPAMICLEQGLPVRNVVMGLISQTREETCWIRIHANPLHVDGKLAGAYACFEDISEHKHIDEQLAETREKLELALAGANLGTYNAHLPSGQVEVNDRYLALLGYVPGELEMSVGEWMNRIHPDDIGRVQAHYDEVVTSATKYVDNEYRLRNKLGNWVWLLDSGRVFAIDERGQATQIAGTVMDITARKNAEALLRQQREQMEQMLAFQIAHQTVAGIAHDLNQPLNAITTLAEAARQQLLDLDPMPAQLAETFEGISQGAQRAGRVVHELMSILKQPKLRHEAVDIAKLLQEVALQCRATLSFAGEIDLQVPANLPLVAGNIMQIEKIVLNLLRNAVEACQSTHTPSEKNRIGIEAANAGKHIYLQVIDNGPGVPAELVKRLFQPFLSCKPGGIGMGLVISQALSHSLGGTLEYEPAPGRGACFRLTLPIIGEEPDGATA